MIEELRVQNFKCLRDVRIELGPLTVLVGPNDSGKTSILEAMYYLGETVEKPCWGRDPNQDSVFHAGREHDRERALTNLVWRRDEGLQPIWDVKARFAQSRADYHLAIPTRGTSFEERLLIDGSGVINQVTPYDQVVQRPLLFTTPFTDRVNRRESMPLQLGQAIYASRIYRFDPRALRSPAQPIPQPSLAPTGFNLAAVLDALVTGPNRKAREAIEQQLANAIPGLAGFALRTELRNDASGTPSSTVKTLDFVLAGNEKQPVTIPAALASDGAMLLLAYLALTYSDTPDILLIEEPENGLHPSRLKMVLELLRQISRGEVGNRPRQVILTTQSPVLLNFAEPEEVRIVRRNEEGATEVTRFEDAPGVKKMLEEFAVGELWYLLGEEALIKGEPQP